MLQYAHPQRAAELQQYTRSFKPGGERYRVFNNFHELYNNEDVHEQRIYRDFWDGRLCAELQQQAGIFDDPRDLAFTLMGDSVQITENTSHEVYPLFLLNFNLHPKQRVSNSLITYSYL